VASGSSSTASGDSRLGNQPRLVECPECAIREIRIRSKQPTTYDQVFYKCPNNMRVRIACTLPPIWLVGLMLGFWVGQGYPSTCGFIRSEEQYTRYVGRLDAVQAHRNGECNAEGIRTEEARW
jgi:hypothetical protein